MKRIISLLLTMCILCTLITVGLTSAGAAVWIKEYRYGDVDQDKAITAIDAVLIQRHIVDLEELSNVSRVAADYDHDKDVSVIDVTFIQRGLANMYVPDYCGGTFNDENRINKFYGTYCSGKTMTGVPVTYTAAAVTGTSVVDYTFTAYKEDVLDGQINRTLVARQSSEKNTFTVEFDEPGWYVITVRSTDEINATDWSTRYHTENVEVVSPYSIKSPVISNYYFDTVINGNELTVGAIGGTAPYQFSYTIEELVTDTTIPYQDEYWSSTVDAYGNMSLYTGYIDSDTVPLLPWSLTGYSWNSYTIKVTAKDANGVVSEPFYIQAPEIVEG